MRLGNQLQRLREAKNMSREELAQQINVSRQAVYKWENNKGYPDIQNLLRLSEIYETTIDELIKNDPTLQRKVDNNQDESKELDDEEMLNPGFYIGIVIIFLGIFLGIALGNLIVSTFLNIIGTLIICFYKDILKFLKNIKKDFNEQ
ncbi:helix-turn-helix domain-containing protein [Priestia megaterium]|uniref:helix-turn-helix domain-containing protein n=1 Tax=Priestia megaterium TaxID=1404 RepID=UPI00064C6C75|nr:helix-turn-helix domain-containing protein [Priestia megaterium]AYE53892.1 helix-turn-helix domain-containing protein [Priestia megaterium NCT-2]KLV28704.1 DNA-binding protein [Priestia megaterium]KNH17400.1 DNA-binding protein [Priestia megaterium]MCE4092732.1 helix-turn-helix domain-containing protein [Priestia megaterium]QSF36358.1 helix-turn-helix domain-containing protein [Priestia megaterium]